MRANKQYKIHLYPNPWDIIDDAYEVSTRCDIDLLDCSKSWSRQSTNMSYEEAKELIQKRDSLHFAFIQHIGFGDQDDYFDVGVCTQSGHPDYFIFLYVPFVDGEDLAKTYNLELFEIQS